MGGDERCLLTLAIKEFHFLEDGQELQLWCVRGVRVSWLHSAFCTTGWDLIVFFGFLMECYRENMQSFL